MISILDQKIHLGRSTRLSNKVLVVVVVVVVVAVAVVAFTFNDFLICPRWIMGNKLQMWTVGTNLCRFSDRPVI